MRRSSILFLSFLTIHFFVLANERLAANPPSASGGTVVDEPYLVFVAEEAAHLRCGPSGEYYRTDPLRHGQELEVYVETGDGWLGVRPAENSFCWIPADTVQLRNNRDADHRGAIRPRTGSSANQVIEAEVIENKTVAWIGTNLGRARRSRWQVQLGQGESVTILGSSERDGPDGPQTWYRIVPPSGEFRWIHQDQVVTTAEDLIASVKPDKVNEPLQFLPDGPSAIAEAKEKPVARQSTFRREAESEVWNRDQDFPAKMAARSERRNDPTIDKIEAKIEARRRDRLASMETPDALPMQPEPTSETLDQDHHPISFSERVTNGLSVLMRGRQPRGNDLEPITESSRRIADLVPIGSGIVQNELPPAPMIQSQVVVEPQVAVESKTTELAHTTPAASAQPGLRSNQSQIAFLSTPRMVTPASSTMAAPADSVASVDSSATLPPVGVGLESQGLPTDAPARHSPHPKIRKIQPEQLEAVRRSVASASAESLPMELSKLMARGASAPEIALVAEAATKFGNRALAIRARDYQSLARRRDGDTLIGPSRRSIPGFQASSPDRAIASAQASPNVETAEPAIARTAFVPTGTQPVIAAATANQAVQSGILVQVYSADPSRPPFAITDSGGRTLAYVTPAPGVEVKKHLGSEVRLIGESGYLQGLETPHVLATSAERLVR